MGERDEVGHEPPPEETDDACWAPVNRGSDARGRTVPGTGTPGTSATGVPDVRTDWSPPDADWRAPWWESLPPDTEGVERAEREDDSW
ncbi:hypothetical protein [Actinomadura atramentaria]|uniref:hypothetical protein n=1 Tax=Actinomadura atramentaria TaxID=1990 RepID=UPI00036FE387|nr:hypothetical protein [Actinomadura atramentaria]